MIIIIYQRLSNEQQNTNRRYISLKIHISVTTTYSYYNTYIIIKNFYLHLKKRIICLLPYEIIFIYTMTNYIFTCNLRILF